MTELGYTKLRHPQIKITIRRRRRIIIIITNSNKK